MKTEFELDCHLADLTGSTIAILGKSPDSKPYVRIDLPAYFNACLFIPDKDLERFAVNILKALKSKKLSNE